MNTLFKHENHPYPPSLSDRGKLRQGKKSDSLSVLVQKIQTEPLVSIDINILDGAAWCISCPQLTSAFSMIMRVVSSSLIS